MACSSEPVRDPSSNGTVWGRRRRHLGSGLGLGVAAGVAGAVLGAAQPVSAAPPVDATSKGGSCRVPADASELVPDGAEFIVSADVAKLAKSDLFGEVKGHLRNDAQVRRTLDGLDACKLGLDDIDRITLAGTRNDEFVVVLEGGGIGSAALLSCAAKQLAPNSPVGTFAPALSGCMTTLDMGDGVGMVLDRRHLVFVSQRWTSKVQQRLDGRGRPAAHGSLKPAMRNAKRNSPIWFAADIDEPIDTGGARYDLEGIAGGLDIGQGLHLDLAARFRSGDQASKLRQELEGYRAMAMLMGPTVGIPPEVIGNVKLSGTGADLGLSLDLTRAQLRQLQHLAQDM